MINITRGILLRLAPRAQIQPRETRGNNTRTEQDVTVVALNSIELRGIPNRSLIHDDVFKKLPDDVFNMLAEYLSAKDMARLSCVLKEKKSDLNQIAKRVSEYLRNELNKKITQTEIDGIQISPGPFRNDIQEMSVLEMQNNNLGTAIKVLEENNITNINEADNRTDTPLHKAASEGNARVVRALVIAGADINATDQYGSTVLHWAAKKGNTEIVEALVIAGAKIDVRDEDRLTALYFAAKTGKTEVVEKLVKAGANLNAKDFAGWTALHWAVRHDSTDIVKALVIAGADVDAKDNDGWTALQMAKIYGRYYKVKKAIKEGKKRLISLYENQQCQVKTPENLTETQKKQARKYIKEQSFPKKFKRLGNIKYCWK